MASDYFFEPWGTNEWGLGAWGGDIDIRYFTEMSQPMFLAASLIEKMRAGYQRPWFVGLNTWGRLSPPVPSDTWSSIDDSQTPVWSSITESQTPDWTPVNEGQ